MERTNVSMTPSKKKKLDKIRRSGAYILIQAGATGLYRLMGGRGPSPTILMRKKPHKDLGVKVRQKGD